MFFPFFSSNCKLHVVLCAMHTTIAALKYFPVRIKNVSYHTSCYNTKSILFCDFEIYVSAHKTYLRSNI